MRPSERVPKFGPDFFAQVPPGVLREVREFWARRRKGGAAPTSSANELHDFLALWRDRPDAVLECLRVARERPLEAGRAARQRLHRVGPRGRDARPRNLLQRVRRRRAGARVGLRAKRAAEAAREAGGGRRCLLTNQPPAGPPAVTSIRFY